MKLLSLAFLLIFLSIFCCAQQPPAPNGSGLTVVKQRWHRDLRNPALDPDADQEANDRVDAQRSTIQTERENDMLRAKGQPVHEIPSGEVKPDMPAASGSADYSYELTIRNDGDKEIAAFTWEYVFLSPETGKEVGRRRFQNKERLRSGKTRTFVVHSAIPPIGTIDASKPDTKKPEKYTEQIVILTVDYTDGTKWSESSH